MAGRIPLALISLIALLLSCSAAPTDTAVIHSGKCLAFVGISCVFFYKSKQICCTFLDTTEIRVEDTTEKVAELFQKVADSTDPSVEENASTDLVDAVAVEVPESSTYIDLEAIEIDVDKIFKKDEPATATEENTTTEMTETTTAIHVPVEKAEAEKAQLHGTPPLLAEPAQLDSPIEKQEIKAETTAGIHESPTSLLQESPSLAAILAEPVQVQQDSPVEKVEVQSDDHTESAQASPVEDAHTTDGPEVDSVIHVVLKVDSKNRTEEKDESTETVLNVVLADTEDESHTESIPVVLKAVVESTDATLDDTTDSILALNDLFKIDVTAVADPVEDGTERSIQSTDSVADPTEPSVGVQADEVVRMEPQFVKIFDPSVDVEATTFLAEANRQTESDTTESFYQADEVDDRGEKDEALVATTDESAVMTTEMGTESGTESVTESGTEVMSETTSALPVIIKQSPPSSASVAAATGSSKKRSYKGYKVYRVILPTEESVRRILSMEDEPGVEFWADPRLLLRPRGLFVTSAADVMVAPKIVPQMEAVFREARLTYTVLIDDVHVSLISFFN